MHPPGPALKGLHPDIHEFLPMAMLRVTKTSTLNIQPCVAGYTALIRVIAEAVPEWAQTDPKAPDRESIDRFRHRVRRSRRSPAAAGRPPVSTSASVSRLCTTIELSPSGRPAGHARPARRAAPPTGRHTD